MVVVSLPLKYACFCRPVQNRMVYRTAITSNLNHWMYSPLQELTKVAAVKYPHLTINFNARTGDTTGANDNLDL